jgi:hypothetical protein
MRSFAYTAWPSRHTIGSIRPELVLDLTPDPDCERQARFDVALREV